MAVPTASPQEAPRRLGRYVLARELWTAAWFSVWSAIDTESGSSPAAVKLVHRALIATDVTRLRLLDAARAGASIVHPNVLETREVLHVDGELAIGTSEIDGIPLREVLRAAASHGVSVPPPVAVRIALELLAALETAHTAAGDEAWPDPITPVDLTPENVVITSAGAVRLVDVTLERAAAGLTSPLAAELVGYRAPERLDRAGDQRSDLFAVGVLLWELLADKPLFSGSNVAEAVRKRTIPRLDDASVRPAGALPNKLASVVARALTRATAGRFPSADHMGQALMSSGAAVASPEDVATLVALVQRARAVAASAARGPVTQVLRQEFLQTPIVGTVVSPLAKPQASPSPSPPAAKAVAPKPVEMARPVAKVALVEKTQPIAKAQQIATTPSVTKAKPIATTPSVTKTQPMPAPPPIAAPRAKPLPPTPPAAPPPVPAAAATDPVAEDEPISISFAEPPPPPKPPRAPTLPSRISTLPGAATRAAPAPIAPIDASTPEAIVPARIVTPAPAPLLDATPPAPSFAPFAPSPAPPIAEAAALPYAYPAASPTPPNRSSSIPPVAPRWWQRRPTMIGGAAFATLLWIVVLASRPHGAPQRVDPPRGTPPVGEAKPPPTPVTPPPRPREDPPPARVAADPTAPMPTASPGDAPPSTPAGGDPLVPGAPHPASSGDATPAAPPDPPPKPPPPRRKYNPKTI